jgi:hypothetical protein
MGSSSVWHSTSQPFFLPEEDAPWLEQNTDHQAVVFHKYLLTIAIFLQIQDLNECLITGHNQYSAAIKPTL